MEKSNDTQISFENVILTPMERWVDMELELEPRIIEYLNQLAKKSNQSVDNVVNHILGDCLAEHLDLSDLNEVSLKKAAEKSPIILFIKEGKPVARVIMLNRKDNNYILASSKNPDKEDCSEVELEPVTNCDRLECVAAI